MPDLSSRSWESWRLRIEVGRNLSPSQWLHQFSTLRQHLKSELTRSIKDRCRYISGKIILSSRQKFNDIDLSLTKFNCKANILIPERLEGTELMKPPTVVTMRWFQGSSKDKDGRLAILIRTSVFGVCCTVALASLRALPLSRPWLGWATSTGLTKELRLVYPCCAAVFASHEATVWVSSLNLV